MAELDLRWFDNPEDEGQLKQLANSIDSLDANILNPNDVGQLLGVFERFPDDDGFEGFWQILHLLERAGGYESALVDSVRRSPGEFNLTMINRLLNGGIENVGAQSLLSLLEESGANGAGRSGFCAVGKAFREISARQGLICSV